MGWPNRISVGRLLLIAPFVACLLSQPGHPYLRHVAVGLFALMAISDFLDGYLARRLKDESPLGAFLDPLADKFLVTFAVIILAIVGVREGIEPQAKIELLPAWVAVAAVGKDLLVSIGFAVVYLSTTRVHIQPRRLGKWCTTAELVMVLAMLLWPEVYGLGRFGYYFVRGLWMAVVALAILATLDYIRAGSRFIAAQAPRDPVHLDSESRGLPR